MKLVRKGWSDYWRRQLAGALCQHRMDLGWIANEPPRRGEFLAMRDICLACPVRRACAEFVMDPDSKVHGGMYAGVWIPWRGNNDGRPAARSHTSARHEIRDLLNRLVETEFQQLMREQSNA